MKSIFGKAAIIATMFCCIVAGIIVHGCKAHNNQVACDAHERNELTSLPSLGAKSIAIQQPRKLAINLRSPDAIYAIRRLRRHSSNDDAGRKSRNHLIALNNNITTNALNNTAFKKTSNDTVPVQEWNVNYGSDFRNRLRRAAATGRNRSVTAAPSSEKKPGDKAPKNNGVDIVFKIFPAPRGDEQHEDDIANDDDDNDEEDNDAMEGLRVVKPADDAVEVVFRQRLDPPLNEEADVAGKPASSGKYDAIMSLLGRSGRKKGKKLPVVGVWNEVDLKTVNGELVRALGVLVGRVNTACLQIASNSSEPNTAETNCVHIRTIMDDFHPAVLPLSSPREKFAKAVADAVLRLTSTHHDVMQHLALNYADKKKNHHLMTSLIRPVAGTGPIQNDPQVELQWRKMDSDTVAALERLKIWVDQIVHVCLQVAAAPEAQISVNTCNGLRRPVDEFKLEILPMNDQSEQVVKSNAEGVANLTRRVHANFVEINQLIVNKLKQLKGTGDEEQSPVATASEPEAALAAGATASEPTTVTKSVAASFPPAAIEESEVVHEDEQPEVKIIEGSSKKSGALPAAIVSEDAITAVPIMTNDTVLRLDEKPSTFLNKGIFEVPRLQPSPMMKVPQPVAHVTEVPMQEGFDRWQTKVLPPVQRLHSDKNLSEVLISSDHLSKKLSAIADNNYRQQLNKSVSGAMAEDKKYKMAVAAGANRVKAAEGMKFMKASELLQFLFREHQAALNGPEGDKEGVEKKGKKKLGSGKKASKPKPYKASQELKPKVGKNDFGVAKKKKGRPDAGKEKKGNMRKKGNKGRTSGKDKGKGGTKSKPVVKPVANPKAVGGSNNSTIASDKKGRTLYQDQQADQQQQQQLQEKQQELKKDKQQQLQQELVRSFKQQQQLNQQLQQQQQLVQQRWSIDRVVKRKTYENSLEYEEPSEALASNMTLLDVKKTSCSSPMSINYIYHVISGRRRAILRWSDFVADHGYRVEGLTDGQKGKNIDNSVEFVLRRPRELLGISFLTTEVRKVCFTYDAAQDIWTHIETLRHIVR